MSHAYHHVKDKLNVRGSKMLGLVCSLPFNFQNNNTTTTTTTTTNCFRDLLCKCLDLKVILLHNKTHIFFFKQLFFICIRTKSDFLDNRVSLRVTLTLTQNRLSGMSLAIVCVSFDKSFTEYLPSQNNM